MGNITEADRDKAQKDWVKAHPGQTPDESAINGQVYQNFYDQAFNATGLGTGGAVQQGIQAATAVVQGLAGGDIAAAIANGSAPYLAEAIGHRMGIDNNPEAKAVAHAIVGAALGAAQGQNAAAGATGAALGEITAGILKDLLYGKDTPVSDLTETQKQTLSALATLSSGLAGGLAGDSTGSAVYAAQAGKTTAENNSLAIPMPPPLVGVQTTPQAEANAFMAKKLDAAMKEFGEQQVEQCLSGGTCPGAVFTALLAISAMKGNGDDKTGSTPNMGQSLTDKEKAESGGAGSGTPGGWGPEDEQNARDKNLSSSDQRSIKSLEEQIRVHEKN